MNLQDILKKTAYADVLFTDTEKAAINKAFIIKQSRGVDVPYIQGIRRSDDIFIKIKSIIFPTKIGETTNYSTDTSILFLNFNYTNTDRQYIDYFSHFYQNGIESVHIHGELNNSNNPIIFGYGDEIDDNYKLI